MGFELSEIVTADGQIYDLMDLYARFVLRNPANMGIPTIEALTIQAGQQGRLLKDYLLEPRELAMDLRHQGCTRDEYWELRLELLDILRPNRGGEMTYIFTVPTGTQYAIKGIITEFPFSNIPEGWDELGFTETMVLLCNDPVWFGYTAATEAFLQSVITELTFPITFTPSGPTIYFQDNSIWGTVTVTYLGTWYSYPTFVATGPFTSLALYHNEKDIIVQLNYAAAAAEIVTIDLENRTITNDSGTDLFGYLSPLSNLVDFRLEPNPILAGGVNTISATLVGNDGSNTVEMSYYTRWIGI